VLAAPLRYEVPAARACLQGSRRRFLRDNPDSPHARRLAELIDGQRLAR